MAIIELKKKKFRAGALALALIFCLNGIAQTPGLGTWNILNGELAINKKWTLFAEAQVRSQRYYNHFSYHEYKGGVSYNITEKAEALVGMGHYVTYNPTGNFKSPVANSEFRFWEQFILINNIDRIVIEHRFRTEQRFTSNGFRNRFRYRIGGTVPLNKRKLEASTLYFTANEEIFLTDKKPFFERSRFFAGGGYVFNDLFTLQAGWLRQFDFSSNLTSFTKNYMQLSLLFDFKR